MTDSLLFSPISLRGMTAPHRLWVAPMCQYSAIDGVVQPWHHVHLGAWAIHKAGLIITEATSVSPEGRISIDDAGLWNDAQAEAWAPIVSFSHDHGVPMVVQLAHAGRKASTRAPFKPGGQALAKEEGGWQTLAPSSIAYGELPAPHEMSTGEIGALVDDFEASAKRAVEVGFAGIELHAAHGYLLHEFFSPLANQRTDAYGGDFSGRTKVARDIVSRVRSVIPDSMPLLVRISATDWLEGGWDLEQSIQLSKDLEALGVDFIDVSSGGLRLDQKIELGPGYQMPFAKAIKESVGISVGTVGLITTALQAEQALRDGVADVVLMGRQFLREPSFATRAARELGVDLEWVGQYWRAK